MLRCSEVTQLCASEEIRRASLWTRASVRIHLLMCRNCRRYVRELAALGDAVRDLVRGAADSTHRGEDEGGEETAAARAAAVHEQLIAQMLEEAKRPDA